jgi:hypothetical protein
MSHRTVRTLLLLAATCVAALVFPAAGMAHSQGDRNRDRIPDRWERAHHLSLNVNQAKRDQDHDGLRNMAEFTTGDDPRDADTDNDGTEDGQEQAGKVVSFTAGVLIVHLFNGDDVKGTVDPNTEFECKAAPTPITPVTPLSATARAASDGPGGGGDEGDGNNNDGSGDHHGHGQSGDQSGDQGDDENDDENGQQPGCDATKLTPGAVVGEAELKATATGLFFTKIELVG